MVFDLWNFQQRAGFPLSQGSQGKSGNLLEDQGKLGQLEIFWKRSEKPEKKIFIHASFFFHIHAEMCAVELYMNDNQLYI